MNKSFLDDIKRKGAMSTLVDKVTTLENNVRRILAVGVLSRTPYPVLYENTPDQLTADQNNFDTGSFGALRVSTNASRTITGFNGGAAGRLLTIFNVGANNLVISHQSASSSAENRVISANAANITLGANDSLTLCYDAIDGRWRVQAIAQ